MRLPRRAAWSTAWSVSTYHALALRCRGLLHPSVAMSRARTLLRRREGVVEGVDVGLVGPAGRQYCVEGAQFLGDAG